MRNLLSVLIFFAASGVVQAQDARGLWQTEMTEDGLLEVRVSSCGAALCGVIETARTPDGTSVQWEHLGRRMIWDMRPDGSGTWSGGKIWDPRRDRAFNSKMTVQGSVMTVSGCFLGICESQSWRRVN